MNRKQRREGHKPQKKPIWHKATKEERMEQLYRNGITAKDLETAFQNGVNTASRKLSTFYQRQIYASICIALHDVAGFGKERCLKILNRSREIAIDEILTEDLLARCSREVGLEINVFDAEQESDFEV